MFNATSMYLDMIICKATFTRDTNINKTNNKHTNVNYKFLALYHIFLLDFIFSWIYERNT